MLVDIQVEGGNVIAILSEGAISSAMLAAAEQAAEFVADELRAFQFKTEEDPDRDYIPFAESIEVNETFDGGFEVRSTAQHAAYIEVGTSGGYIIRPRDGKVVVFDGNKTYELQKPKKGGAMGKSGRVAVPFVIHPGIQDPPKPFDTVIQRSRLEIDRIMSSSMQAAFNVAASGGRSGVRSTVTKTGRTVFFQTIPGVGNRFVSPKKLGLR